MPDNELEPGLHASTEILVGTRDTAHHVGSGKIEVLATPVMVMLPEEAALNSVEGLLSRATKPRARISTSVTTWRHPSVEVERIYKRTREKTSQSTQRGR